MKKKVLFLILLVCLGIFVSCSNYKHEKEWVFAGDTWNRFVPFMDTIDITDIEKQYDLNVAFSVWDNFEYSLVPLEIVVYYPNGQESVFKKYYSIKDLQGNHLGTVKGNVWTVDMNVFESRTFPEKGKYIFSVQHLTQYYDLPKVQAIKTVLTNSKKKSQKR